MKLGVFSTTCRVLLLLAFAPKGYSFRSSPITRLCKRHRREYYLTQNKDDSGGSQLEDSQLFEITDEIDTQTLEEIEASQPSPWMVMKEVLGINIFTYILAAAIAIFFGLNSMFGPGWLGNSLGFNSNWDAPQTSGAEVVDLSKTDYLL